ncbi:hypothetical protein GCM10022243_20040 [Saccharothrix violaceirubra]|uniref:Agd3 CBM87 domain-containing protein n=1 Tax=Saccharothrix violaceirubra TaxID=413306 RepID=A0A7W7T1Y6_9PSEU|nr:hypothetical protein [Saccharothrix violaceirubra]MBB4965092.1 hypothetical protein [Saccharothrix violaceirubra]
MTTSRSRRKWLAALLVPLAGAATALLPAAPAAGAHSAHPHHGHIRGQVKLPTPPAPPRLARLTGSVTPKAAAPLAATDKVALRPLVIALDKDDFGLPTWKTVLGRIGSPYDVLYAKTEQLTAGRLVLPDGTGRYNAILLTDNALLYPDGSGNYVSGLDAAEWQALWAYESTYKVRQASLYTSYGTFPEDYCLRAGEEGGGAFTAKLTTAGAQVFDYLKADAQIPITDSYVYRTTVAAGCSAQPLLTVGDRVLGVTSTSTDGRERAGLTFSSHESLQQVGLLGYGLVRWATRGVFSGELRHWINVDVDDWFNSSDHLYPDGHVETDPGFRLTGPEVSGIDNQQKSLRTQFPAAAGFTLNLPYNGGDLDPEAPSQCSTSNTSDSLTSYSLCLKRNFRWVNHTLTHPEMNFTSAAVNRQEISENLEVGRDAGLTVPTEILKTPAYSGLGVYNPDPNAPDTDPPTDFGLAKSNKALLDAAYGLGVRYVHGNMSFTSHQPSCFNCGIYHPLRKEILVVPDWPTNIGYQATAPAEQALFYNQLYGPNGRIPQFPRNLTYAEQLEYESNVTLSHLTSGSAYAHTLHQGNLRQYSVGKSLTFDWLQLVVAKYTAKFKVPLRNPDWPALSTYVKARNAHFSETAAGRDPVWDKSTGKVTYTAATTGSLFLTGVTGVTGTVDRYGSDNIVQIPVKAGGAITGTATPRP